MYKKIFWVFLFITVLSFGNFGTNLVSAEDTEIPPIEDEEIVPEEEVEEEPEPEACPEGQTGIFPDCIDIEPEVCPEGYTGIFPDCIAPEPEEEIVEVTFIIRNGDSLIFNESIPLPDTETVEITDSNNVVHNVDAQSVLALLKSIDDANESFLISNLQYFDSFASFYLKCILPAGAEELCDNWQYAVGGFTPFSGIENTILSGGETVGIYFGTSRQVVLSTNTITAGASLNATAQKYNYENNEWGPLTGVTIGVTLPNPEDPWNPLVVSTHPVDDLGNATITITNPNTYTLGIVEDFYFPSYNVTVSPAPEEDEESENGGGGGGGSGTPEKSFDIEDALNYLKNVQNADGSFGGSSLYADWAAIAFGSMNITGEAISNLISYFASNNTPSSLLTDNERRAMALMSLGENPYSFEGINYIESIVEEFDGTQFGDSDLVNDDIFALIPLLNAGYDKGDEMISKSIEFIISEQKNNGSWEESIDVTAAAIQALNPFRSVDGVSDAIDLAEEYLMNKQNTDGGWENVSSTSWALQAMHALGETWIKTSKTGMNYLAEQQEEDGAVSPVNETLQNRIWETSYAIAAASEKTWKEIMQSFSAPENSENTSQNVEDTSSNTETEDVDSETTTDPVICPLGDLFSTTTGEPCTEHTIVDEVIIESIESTPEILTTSNEINNANETLTSENFPNEEIIITEKLEIDPETLTATTVNAPITKNTSQNLPIAIGSASILILLYVALKKKILS